MASLDPHCNQYPGCQHPFLLHMDNSACVVDAIANRMQYQQQSSILLIGNEHSYACVKADTLLSSSAGTEAAFQSTMTAQLLVSCRSCQGIPTGSCCHAAVSRLLPTLLSITSAPNHLATDCLTYHIIACSALGTASLLHSAAAQSPSCECLTGTDQTATRICRPTPQARCQCRPGGVRLLTWQTWGCPPPLP
jgi:hypothetical protein